MPQKSKGEQSVVRVSTGIREMIDDFLKSDTARQYGWDSKKDVVNAAVLDFLRKYRVIK